MLLIASVKLRCMMILKILLFQRITDSKVVKIYITAKLNKFDYSDKIVFKPSNLEVRKKAWWHLGRDCRPAHVFEELTARLQPARQLPPVQTLLSEHLHSDQDVVELVKSSKDKSVLQLSNCYQRFSFSFRSTNRHKSQISS